MWSVVSSACVGRHCIHLVVLTLAAIAGEWTRAVFLQLHIALAAQYILIPWVQCGSLHSLKDPPMWCTFFIHLNAFPSSHRFLFPTSLHTIYYTWQSEQIHNANTCCSCVFLVLCCTKVQFTWWRPQCRVMLPVRWILVKWQHFGSNGLHRPSSQGPITFTCQCVHWRVRCFHRYLLIAPMFRCIEELSILVVSVYMALSRLVLFLTQPLNSQAVKNSFLPHTTEAWCDIHVLQQ